MIEVEPFGVEYERYSLAKCLGRLARRYALVECAELPAHGAKAMPSIYSLGLAAAGVKVTLVNPAPTARANWEAAGLAESMVESQQADLHHTSFAEGSFDLVWNFAYFPTDPDPQGLLQEMIRVSRRYVAVFSVNGWNVGAFIHRGLHRRLRIPWTHGDLRFNFPGKLAEFMRAAGLEQLQVGVVDCPFWPDSLGFRDIRLHRQGTNAMSADWQSKSIEWTRTGDYPGWISGVYAFESLPMPRFLKYLYSHICYVIGRKRQ